MLMKHNLGLIAAGSLAGIVNGLLGAGGGLVLVPLLSICTDLSDEEIFPSSIFVILPICTVSLLAMLPIQSEIWKTSLPYLLGSGAGGILSGLIANKIPVKWLHRLLGILILWGGYRYLC